MSNNTIPRMINGKDNQEYLREWHKRNPEKAILYRRKRYENKPEKYMWLNARTRAKKYGVPFTITKEDIVIPEKCPILGIALVMQTGKYSDNSASLDRIIPSLGYVPGNIAVISWRANRMKNAWSLEELTYLVEWMKIQNV